jgi:hypothetical protein
VGEYGTILTSPAVDVAVEKNHAPAVDNKNLSVQYITPNKLRISLPKELRSSSTTVSIFNIAGKRFYNSTIFASPGEAHMSITSIPAGVYCLGIKSNGQKRFAKFAVVR